MNMKKWVSMLVAAALVCTMSTTAFAADQDGVGTGSYYADVKGTYHQAGDSGRCCIQRGYRLDRHELYLYRRRWRYLEPGDPPV